MIKIAATVDSRAVKFLFMIENPVIANRRLTHSLLPMETQEM
jgi:hypothetical protein